MRIIRTFFYRRFKPFLAFLIFLSPIVLSAQDTSFARKTIDTLSSSYFSGRGYVYDGAMKASHYIADQFSSYHVKTFEGFNGYFQTFQMPVNTFPGKLKVSIDGKLLVPGQDYLVNAYSAGINKRNLKIYHASVLKTMSAQEWGKINFKNSAIFGSTQDVESCKELIAQWETKNALDEKMKPIFIVEKPKLTWTVYSGTDIPNIVALEVKEGVIDAKAKRISLRIEQKYIPHYTVQNVCGYIKGKTYPDSFIFFTAHYDHLGNMGCKTYFPGANDNASGTAMLLNLAQYYSKPENQPEYSIVFVAFTAEEAGLIGSKYFTENSPMPLSQISFLINMDLIGNGEDGIMVVNGSVFKNAYDALLEINAKHSFVKEIKQRGKAANSDHYWFSEKGVPAFFIYLLGEYPYYHDIYDIAEKPTLKGYIGTFNLLTHFVKWVENKR